MHALILFSCLLCVSPDAPTQTSEPTADPTPADAPVVLAQRDTRRRRPDTRRRRPARGTQVEQKSEVLDTLWGVYMPPGGYTIAVGAGVGTTLTETAPGTPTPSNAYMSSRSGWVPCGSSSSSGVRPRLPGREAPPASA